MSEIHWTPCFHLLDDKNNHIEQYNQHYLKALVSLISHALRQFPPSCWTFKLSHGISEYWCMKCAHIGPTMLHLNFFVYILQVYSKILHFFIKFKCKEKRSEHISPKFLVCLCLYLTISLSFHLPPPFILIFILATNLFAIFIFHAVFILWPQLSLDSEFLLKHRYYCV